MTEYSVIFTPEAEEQLTELYHYIAEKASPTSALRYTNAIVDFCATMKAFPHRGVARDDIRRKSLSLPSKVDSQKAPH